MDEDRLQSQHCAELLKALAEPLRLRIVDVLRDGPRNVGDIAGALGVELMNASHHLGILRNAGIVERERRGRFALYKLKADILDRGNLDLGCCQLKLPEETQ